jgi:hypothetical protein
MTYMDDTREDQELIDAAELLKQDLQQRNEPIRHRAGFRGCESKLDYLRDQLISELDSVISDAKSRLFYKKVQNDTSKHMGRSLHG